MAGWKGWQDDTLKAWKAPNGAQNVTVLNIWAQCVPSGAKNNPLACTRKEHGSSDYQQSPVQNYPSSKVALTAYRTQIEQPEFSEIRAAFKAGNPIDRTGEGHALLDQLVAWGVDRDRFVGLLNAVTEGPPKPTPGAHPPKGVSSAWRNMLRFYSRDVPKAHGQATKLAASYRHIFK